MAFGSRALNPNGSRDCCRVALVLRNHPYGFAARSTVQTDTPPYLKQSIQKLRSYFVRAGTNAKIRRKNPAMGLEIALKVKIA
jgi:hypothetical protein